MQATKDTFYMTLRDRLAEIDPDLTAVIDGVERPAIVVTENEPPSASPRQDEVFYIDWGGMRPVQPTSTLMAMDGAISYTTSGESDNGGVGRGRRLSALDADLLMMCSPARSRKYDYAGGSPADLRSYIFWSVPELKPLKVAAKQVGRQAQLTVFFYPEVNQR